MTVAELIDELKYFDSNDEIAIKVSNSSYPESIRTLTKASVSSFWGNDFNAVVIMGDTQIGAV